MQARDIMTSTDIYASGEEATIKQVAKMMADHDIGSIPVLDNDGKLEGIITDRDICVRGLAQGLGGETPVRNVMTPNPYCVHPDADLTEIERVMEEHKVRRVPVVNDEGRLEGFISTADLFRHCSKEHEHELVEVLEIISRPG